MDDEVNGGTTPGEITHSLTRTINRECFSLDLASDREVTMPVLLSMYLVAIHILSVCKRHDFVLIYARAHFWPINVVRSAFLC